MKIAATADLHYNVPRSKAPTERLAETLRDVDPDVLLLVGDLAGRDTDTLKRCFDLFAPMRARRLYVPGNHELWVRPGEDSLHRYRHRLAEICTESGVQYLPAAPVVIGRIGFVGSIGWYDYSFRARSLPIPERFYHAKVAPGAAAMLDHHAHLLEDRSDLTDDLMAITTRWMDGVHVRMGLDDATFLGMLIDDLNDHLRRAAESAETIVAAIHHLPFPELVRRVDEGNWAFASAYMGSERLGQALLAEPKVRHVFCGHSHWPGQVKRGHLHCVNVGATYVIKRYKELIL